MQDFSKILFVQKHEPGSFQTWRRWRRGGASHLSYTIAGWLSNRHLSTWPLAKVPPLPYTLLLTCAPTAPLLWIFFRVKSRTYFQKETWNIQSDFTTWVEIRSGRTVSREAIPKWDTIRQQEPSVAYYSQHWHRVTSQRPLPQRVYTGHKTPMSASTATMW